MKSEPIRPYPRAMRDDDDPREAPPTVVGASAAGVAPLPFLAVYAVLFISHGTFHPVVPPDITNSKRGELVAGLIALGLFVLVIVAVVFLMTGRRRWPFVVLQVATIATCIDFIADETTGSPFLPILLLITSVAALVLALTPQTAAHVQRPGRLRMFSRSHQASDPGA